MHAIVQTYKKYSEAVGSLLIKKRINNGVYGKEVFLLYILMCSFNNNYNREYTEIYNFKLNSKSFYLLLIRVVTNH